MLIDPELRQRVIKSLSWMVEDNCNRSDECRLNFEPESKGGYSEELTEAIDLLNYLKKIACRTTVTVDPQAVIQLTEQQCRDQAVMIGLTDDWGSAYYNTYASQGWCKGNGVPITDVRLHMVKLRNDGFEFSKKTATNERRRKMPILMGKVCGEKENDRSCGRPAVFYRADLTYPYHQCANHISEKVKQAFREQGYDV